MYFALIGKKILCLVTHLKSNNQNGSATFQNIKFSLCLILCLRFGVNKLYMIGSMYNDFYP